MHYEFGSYVLNTDRFEIRLNDEIIQAEPQVIELITLLIENRNRMVSKDEINEKVWQGRIVSDSALNSRIKTARQILGDSGSEQKIIRTIHKKGYRFVADLTANKSHQLDNQNADDPNKTKKPTIAVLPFINMSNNHEQEYLIDGITTDIISHLSKHRWLDVTSRNTTFGFKGKNIEISEIAEKLNVNYVVEGSFQQAGNRIRITVNLIEAPSGYHKWSERYSRELDDIFELQDEITAKIVARIEPEIGYAERHKISTSRPANLRAWDCFHLAMHHFYKFTAEDNIEAQNLLEQCQRRDENFGESYAWWAYTVILGMVYWDIDSNAHLLNSALEACQKALSLDNQNATFYALEGRVLLAQKEYSHAILANKKAISLNPTLAVAHCSLADSFAYEGRYEEAMILFNQAIELSPNDPQLWAFYTYGALALIFKGDYECALEWTESASNIPNYQYWTTSHKLVAHAYLGNEAEVNSTKKKLLKECPKFSCSFARKKLFFLKKQSQVDTYIKGLCLAGIKESEFPKFGD